MSENTPTKPVKKRGRKPKEQDASDFCRVCKVNFKLNGTYLSCENLHKKAGAGNLSLSRVITETLELCLSSEPYLSSRVCSKCALKIRNAAERLKFIRENINVPHGNFMKTKESGQEYDKENQDPEEILRFKRLAKSPGLAIEKRRKGESERVEESTDRREARAKRPLLFGDQNITRQEEKSPSLNIDPSLIEKPKSLEVVVHLNFSSGPRVKEIDDANTRSVIKNVAQNNWKAAVNNPACQDFLKEAVRSTISREFKDYCHSTTSVLKYTAPSELASFSNTLVRHEVKTMCPMWNSALEGALGPCKNEAKTTRATNVSALCTAAAAKFRNSRMSAFAHRVSVVLLHSGAKSHDFMRLNRLGICMSHKETISKQKEMAKAHDSSVLIWKRELELSKKCELLLREIKSKQVPVYAEDDMEVEVLLDLSESTISGYTNYSVEVFSKCLHFIQQELIKAQCNEATEETLEQAIRRMSGEFSSLPKYRYESKLYKSQQIYYNLFMYFIVLSPGCREPSREQCMVNCVIPVVQSRI